MQVLHGLGHDALIRRHDQQGQVDAAGPGQHVAHELFVARHIDDARPASVGQIQVGKTQLNGDAPLLLFPQAVGLNACQGPDQTGLSMVHMACRANDDVVHSVSSGDACPVISAKQRAR